MVATDPIAFDDDFNAAVARARRAIVANGENRLDVREEFQSPLSPEERDVIMSLLRDGTYAAAAGRVAIEDPDFADQ
ncbi:MAG TPA: hypothetical protein VGB03_09485 [Acidimicrobiales bacterium]|jgi:hypothetical protein